MEDFILCQTHARSDVPHWPKVGAVFLMPLGDAPSPQPHPLAVLLVSRPLANPSYHILEVLLAGHSRAERVAALLPLLWVPWDKPAYCKRAEEIILLHGVQIEVFCPEILSCWTSNYLKELTGWFFFQLLLANGNWHANKNKDRTSASWNIMNKLYY